MFLYILRCLSMTSLILLAFQRERGGLVSAHVECHWDTANIPAFETELQQSISSDCLNFDIRLILRVIGHQSVV